MEVISKLTRKADVDLGDGDEVIATQQWRVIKQMLVLKKPTLSKHIALTIR